MTLKPVILDQTWPQYRPNSDVELTWEELRDTPFALLDQTWPQNRPNSEAGLKKRNDSAHTSISPFPPHYTSLYPQNSPREYSVSDNNRNGAAGTITNILSSLHLDQTWPQNRLNSQAELDDWHAVLVLSQLPFNPKTGLPPLQPSTAGSNRAGSHDTHPLLKLYNVYNEPIEIWRCHIHPIKVYNRMYATSARDLDRRRHHDALSDYNSISRHDVLMFTAFNAYEKEYIFEYDSETDEEILVEQGEKNVAYGFLRDLNAPLSFLGSTSVPITKEMCCMLVDGTISFLQWYMPGTVGHRVMWDRICHEDELEHDRCWNSSVDADDDTMQADHGSNSSIEDIEHLVSGVKIRDDIVVWDGSQENTG